MQEGLDALISDGKQLSVTTPDREVPPNIQNEVVQLYNLIDDIINQEIVEDKKRTQNDRRVKNVQGKESVTIETSNGYNIYNISISREHKNATDKNYPIDGPIDEYVRRIDCTRYGYGFGQDRWILHLSLPDGQPVNNIRGDFKRLLPEQKYISDDNDKLEIIKPIKKILLENLKKPAELISPDFKGTGQPVRAVIKGGPALIPQEKELAKAA